MGQPGMVQQLTEKFDSGITAPQEGAAGQKAGVTHLRSVFKNLHCSILLCLILFKHCICRQDVENV